MSAECGTRSAEQKAAAQLQAWQFVNREGVVTECAWCNEELKHPFTHDVTHGICPRHKAAVMDELASRRAAAAMERQAA